MGLLMAFNRFSPLVGVSDLNRVQQAIATVVNPLVNAANAAPATGAPSMVVTLTPGAKSGSSIVVAGAVTDDEGNQVTTAQVVRLLTIPKTSGQGAITVKSGTLLAGAGNQMAVQTLGNGTFAFSVADSASGDVVYVEAALAGALLAAAALRGF